MPYLERCYATYRTDLANAAMRPPELACMSGADGCRRQVCCRRMARLLCTWLLSMGARTRRRWGC
eukprot:125949-Rhodomonas_salina.1